MNPVQLVDYDQLVADMSVAGFEGMAEILSRKVTELGKPGTKNTVLYFFHALWNAARSNDVVWMWLATQPRIRHFGPPEVQYHTSGIFCSELILPEINGPDDEPLLEVPDPGPVWPSEPTETNFRIQARAFDTDLKRAATEHPDNSYKNIREYVAKWYYSGSGQMVAQTHLIELGYNALATSAGIQWLMATYPPESVVTN